MINGGKLTVKRGVTLMVELEGKKLNVDFGVVENDRWAECLIRHRTMNEFKKMSEKKRIPIECQIDTRGAAPISWSRPIRSEKDKIVFQEMLIKLEADGIIEGSNSMWLNPTVLTRKKNGKLRFCIDFRRLNDLVQLDGYRVPKISELLSVLKGNQWFSTIDFVKIRRII